MNHFTGKMSTYADATRYLNISQGLEDRGARAMVSNIDHFGEGGVKKYPFNQLRLASGQQNLMFYSLRNAASKIPELKPYIQEIEATRYAGGSIDDQIKAMLSSSDELGKTIASSPNKIILPSELDSAAYQFLKNKHNQIPEIPESFTKQLEPKSKVVGQMIIETPELKNILQQADFPIDKCLSSGGRVGFANPAGLVKGSNQCIIGVINDEMKLAKKSGDMAKFSKFGRLVRGGGYLIGWADIPIELAFALPSLLAGDVQGAKRATTAGLFGWGGKKIDEINQEKNPEVYKYFKHVQDINDWMDAFNKEKIFESKLNELPEGYAEIYQKHGDKSGYTDFHLKQYNEAVAKQEDITKNYIGYKDELGEEDLKAQEIARQGAQEYLGKEVEKGWKEGMDLDLFLPPSMRVAKDVFGLETKKVAPFKPDKITNLEDLIKQKGDPFYGKWWKRGTRYAAEELGAEEKLYGDWAERQFGKKDPEDIYSELPLEYASQLAALEKKEVMKDPQYKYVYRKPWEGVGFAGGGIANLTRTVAPDSEGIMSLKKKR